MFSNYSQMTDKRNKKEVSYHVELFHFYSRITFLFVFIYEAKSINNTQHSDNKNNNSLCTPKSQFPWGSGGCFVVKQQ